LHFVYTHFKNCSGIHATSQLKQGNMCCTQQLITISVDQQSNTFLPSAVFMDDWAQLFHLLNIQMWHTGYVQSSTSKSLLLINTGPTHTHTHTHSLMSSYTVKEATFLTTFYQVKHYTQFLELEQHPFFLKFNADVHCTVIQSHNVCKPQILPLSVY